MPNQSLLSALQAGKTLLSDGAWGTMLQQKGLRPGQCPEEWCLSRPDEVAGIARAYREAGADMVKTNSFGANAITLARHGLSAQAEAINRAAAQASREGAGEGLWVLGCMGPTGKLLLTEEVTEEELSAAFAEQAKALAEGGADALCVETMSDAQEAALAVRAAREHTALPVISTFVFEKTARGEYRTMMGVSPEEAALAALSAGAQIIGANCGNGMKDMVEIARVLRAAAPETPILIHANAGLPQRIDGADIFPETPEEMAALVPALIRAGAGILGGCCGTTPSHIACMREALDRENEL